MKKTFRKGTLVFVFANIPSEKYGYGKVARTVSVKENEFVIVEMLSGLVQAATAKYVYPIANNRVGGSVHCSAPVVRGPIEDAFMQPWPYYCPDCGELLETKQTERVSEEQFSRCLFEAERKLQNM